MGSFRSVFFFALFFATAPAFAESPKITISCGSNGLEFEICKSSVNEWSQKTGNPVEIITTPNDSNERLSLYQQILGAKSSDIDVLQIDVVWTGILADHLLDLSPLVSKEILKEHFPATIRNNTIKDHLVAMPWFIDAGVMYYRKDLLDKYKQTVPATWADLATVSKKIQAAEHATSNPVGNKDLWGYVFEGRAYEGLTCNALEWIASFDGGAVIDEKGHVSVNNPNSAKALSLISSFIGDIAPQGVLNYSEEEARGVFQSGNAVFMRNWPYAWALLNAPDSKVKDKVGIAVLPSGAPGEKSAATLGGWSLAVSKYTKNQVAAADLVKYLTSRPVQLQRLLKGSFNPTIASLYEDKKVLAQVPQLKLFKKAFSSAVARPSKLTGFKYNRVSSEFWNSVHGILETKESPERPLVQLEATLNRISDNGKW